MSKKNKIINLLKDIAEYSNGHFVTPLITNIAATRNDWHNYKRHNKEHFESICSGKADILCTTPAFTVTHGLPLLSGTPEKLPPVEVLRGVLWSGYLIDTGTRLKLPSDGLVLNKDRPMFLDDFGSEALDNDIKIIITTWDRIEYIKSVGKYPVIPRCCSTKWGKKTINSYYEQEIKKPMGVLYKDVPLSNILDGSFKPTSDDECHKDKRIYAKFPEPISGIDKREADLRLEERGAWSEDYMFGVWPKDSNNGTKNNES